MQHHLDQLLARIPHLQQIVVTDKEGIEIAKCRSHHSLAPSATQHTHRHSNAHKRHRGCPFLSPSLSRSVLCTAVDESLSLPPLSSALPSLFATAAEQAGKLGIGRNQYILTTHSNHTLLQVNLLPVVVTLVASPQVNVGLLINAIPELKAKLEGTRQTVAAMVNDMAKDRQQ